MAHKIQVRRDTSSNWTSTNPILASGEIGLETNTLRFKIGNGTAAWNVLAYKSDTGAPGNGINMDMMDSGDVVVGSGSDVALTDLYFEYPGGNVHIEYTLVCELSSAHIGSLIVKLYGHSGAGHAYGYAVNGNPVVGASVSDSPGFQEFAVPLIGTGEADGLVVIKIVVAGTLDGGSGDIVVVNSDPVGGVDIKISQASTLRWLLTN